MPAAEVLVSPPVHVYLYTQVLQWRDAVRNEKKVMQITLKAEYTDLSCSARECIRLRHLLNELSFDIRLSPKMIFCDNQKAICLTSNKIKKE